MPYYTTDIQLAAISPAGLGLQVIARTGQADKAIQCYVGGELADWQRPRAGEVRFLLPRSAGDGPIALLAVDRGEERVNYWADAFLPAARYGSRIRVEFRLDLLDGRHPGDLWRVYRGQAGSGEADTLVHEAQVHPGGRGATGWGFDWGRGGWGFSGSNAPGWGHHWGYTWGYGIDFLTWTSPPLERGAYRVRVELADPAGNVSQAHETTVFIDTYPRPPRDLAVDSYDRQTDTLTLTFTPSEDLA